MDGLGLRQGHPRHPVGAESLPRSRHGRLTTHADPQDAQACQPLAQPGLFTTWAQATHCTGEEDPRILPLHSFETSQDWPYLDIGAVNRKFEEQYGPAARRTDDGGRLWTRPNKGEYHGSAVQIVAGHRLQGGMHWHVTTRGGATRFFAPHRVWSLPSGNAYINVYPNGYVNVGRAGHVPIIWEDRSRAT